MVSKRHFQLPVIIVLTKSRLQRVEGCVRRQSASSVCTRYTSNHLCWVVSLWVFTHWDLAALVVRISFHVAAGLGDGIGGASVRKKNRRSIQKMKDYVASKKV